MASIFTFKDHKNFIRERFKTLDGGDYGQASKLAKYLNVHTTFVSQALSGIKFFSPEQGLRIASFFDLTPLETDYLLTLIQIDRASTPEYRKHLDAKLAQISHEANKLVNRVQHQKKISPEEQSQFYSDWVYSACRLSAFIPGKNTVAAISKYLGLRPVQVTTITNFLVKARLLNVKNGKFTSGPESTHLGAESPWIKSHHRNWRMEALDRVGKSQSNMHYTAPMTLSKKDFMKVKEMLVKTVNDIDKVVGPSDSETLVCLNIDWFQVSKDDEDLI